MAVTPDGTGDWVAEQDGTVLSLGEAAGHGSLRNVPPTAPGDLDRRHAGLGDLRPPVPERVVRLRHQLAPVQGAALARHRRPARAAVLPGRDHRLHRRRRRGRRLGGRCRQPVPAGRGAVGSPGQGHRRCPLQPLHVPQLADLVRHDRPAGPVRHLRRLLGRQAGDVPCVQLRLQLGPDGHAVRRQPGRLLAGVVARHRERHLRAVLVLRPDAQLAHHPGRARLPALRRR